MADTESAPGVSAAQVSAIIAEEVSPTTPVASQAAMLALPDFPGQRAIRTDLAPNQIYIQTTSPATVLANWQLTTADVASEVAFVPNGDITETNVQTAVQGVRDRAAAAVAALRYQIPITFGRNETAPFPSTFVLNAGRYWVLPDGVTRSVRGSGFVQAQINLGVSPVLTFKHIVSALGAGDANARFQVLAKYIPTNGDAGSGVDETFPVTVPITNVLNQTHEVNLTLDGTKIDPFGTMQFTVSRLGADGADTFTGDLAINESAQVLRA